MRPLFFLLLAAALSAYAFWVYTRVELQVPEARRLAVVRACALVLVLLLLFDPRIPAIGAGAAPARWVLLDASVSMSAEDPSGAAAWTEASERAVDLESDGWSVVRFGGEQLEPGVQEGAAPTIGTSRLLPALQAAAEAGAREVRVLSDMRFEDAVALRGAVESLPLEVTFERFGAVEANVGVARFRVPDVPRPDEGPTAEVEIHGGVVGDSVEVVILEEEEEVARVRIAAPSPGLRGSRTVELPAPSAGGRVRYTARVAPPADSPATRDDGFADDDSYVTYANVGYEEGGLILVSLRPDWEPRHLLPVLEEVTGLSASAYLRAGPDRYVRSGRAADRGTPVDSATVRRAASDAALLVIHGLGEDADGWIRTVAARPSRRLILPADAEGASVVGVETGTPQEGEWYASPDVPTSPIAGALSGVELQGLPPLTGVMAARSPNTQPVLQLQLRGAGAPANAFHLVDSPDGRLVVALSSAYWRWAAREEGREAYRSLWSGLAGWLLAGQRAAAAEPKPVAWVVARGEAVEWTLPAIDSSSYQLSVEGPDGVVVDTVLMGASRATIPPMEPAVYAYTVRSMEGDTVATGRFDVVRSTLDMLPAAVEPDFAVLGEGSPVAVAAPGRPLRTSPFPYLLVLMLLCGEWIVRRRSGLR
jgi:hypothetical protein